MKLITTIAKPRPAMTLSALALSMAIAPSPVNAQEVINLTVGSSHPTTIPWVGMIPDVFIKKVNEVLEEEGEYQVNWTEAYAGQLYGTNATLTSIQDGIADIGWVFSYLEGSRMPLSQISAYTPFTTSDPELMLEVMNDLVRSEPAFRAEWEDHDLVFLGATASDTYDIYTDFPVESLDDLDGARISAPGVLGVWLEPVGSVPVDGTLASYYTDIQTGVSQGVVGLATGNLSARVYEVAPYITQANLGVVFSGGLAINQFTWDGLPEPVQDALMQAGETYTLAHGRDLAERYESSLERMVELGAEQSTPVQINTLSDEERQEWIDGMPDLANQWIERNEERGLPARELLETYMDAMRERGHEPERAWDQE
ncbi:C4-dicarboxylate TRAP transporter substrate-binding protein [Halomonas sp. hl-4]|uniref:C4-dicarboxylate TRAP transporter substrate-binding protein n=1 Tax=Halomonas sp. hl-4 TaxID=1761789 RepID=UPI000BB8DC40|nr:C4-dicarboxylate TRAP transporter substrate-binding protein [Halomonas sp. hl-4]SNY98293.1 TRAP-type C4-dicarboxylate transport system, substrate-binding protein [Halomonas sp. hl-4]